MVSNKLIALLVASALVSFAACGGGDEKPAEDGTDGSGAESLAWSYEGETGPENWGKLSEDFAACNGDSQSPIDVPSAESQEPAVVGAVTAEYGTSSLKMVDTGFGIQVNVDEGTGSFMYGGTTYKVAQFHFHTPSEHSVDGKLADAAVHFVHLADDGTALVRGFLLNIDADAEESGESFLTVTADNAEKVWGSGTQVAVENASVDLTFLNDSMTWWNYSGSLTTPGCNEIVTWILHTEPISISQADFDAIKGNTGDTNRPVQPLNDRELHLETAGS